MVLIWNKKGVQYHFKIKFAFSLRSCLGAQTTLTRIWLFLTTYPLHLNSLPYKSWHFLTNYPGNLVDFLDLPTFPCKRSLWTNPYLTKLKQAQNTNTRNFHIFEPIRTQLHNPLSLGGVIFWRISRIFVQAKPNLSNDLKTIQISFQFFV